MKIFSTVTNQTLPQQPTPVEEWKLENQVKDLTADLEATTLKSEVNKEASVNAEENKEASVNAEESKEATKLNFIAWKGN